MKHEKALATFLALIGLSLMSLAADQPPEKASIGELNERMVGEKVTVEGEIRNLSASEDTLFFTLRNGSEKIKAVTFRENLLITEGSKIKAEGKVTIYNGDLELVVKNIRN